VERILVIALSAAAIAGCWNWLRPAEETADALLEVLKSGESQSVIAGEAAFCFHRFKRKQPCFSG
jgi:hypothetical protein